MLYYHSPMTGIKVEGVISKWLNLSLQMLEMQTLARQFFTLPIEVKQEYARPGPGLEENYGWTTLEREG